jgi:DNA helicase TIP49 (TBP-interacting protein)
MPELLERERAMREVEGAVAALRRGRGGVVLVQGPPGSGRTAVVEAAAGVARRAGSTVRSWTAVDDEAGLALSTADA